MKVKQAKGLAHSDAPGATASSISNQTATSSPAGSAAKAADDAPST